VASTLLAVWLAAGGGAAGSAGAAGPEPGPIAGSGPVSRVASPIRLPRLGAASNFALTTSQGARIWLTQLRPRLVVLTFGCVQCDMCAGQLVALADVARELGDAAGRQAFFAFVTVDPVRDTPAVLRSFARGRGLLAPAWLFLTGEPDEIAVVLRRYDVPVRREGTRLVPRCATMLIDRTGILRAAYDPIDRERLRADLAALLVEGDAR
jgi:protein SCO1/2